MDLAGRTKTSTGYENIWRPTSAKWRHKPSHATAHVLPRSNNRPSLLRLDSVGEISSGGIQFTKSKMTPKISLAESNNMKAKTMGNVNNLFTSFGAAIFSVGKLEGRKSLSDNSQKIRLFSGEKEKNIPSVTLDEKYRAMSDYCSNGNRCDSWTEDMNRLQSTVNSLNTCPGFMAFAPQWYTGSSTGWTGLCSGNQCKVGNKNLWQQPCYNPKANEMKCGGQFTTVSEAMYPFTDYLCSKNNYSTVNMTNISAKQNEGCRRPLDRTVCQLAEEKISNIANPDSDLASYFHDLSIGRSCKSNPPENEKVPEMSEVVEQCSDRTRFVKDMGENLGKSSAKVMAAMVYLPSTSTVQPSVSDIKLPGRCLKRTFSYPLYTSNSTESNVLQQMGSVRIINGLKLDKLESKSVREHCSDDSKPTSECVNVANPCSPDTNTKHSDINDKIDVRCSGNLSRFSFSVKKHRTNDGESASPPVPVSSSQFYAMSTEGGLKKPKSCKRPRPSSKKRRRQKSRQQTCFVNHDEKASTNEHGDPGYSMQSNKKCKFENPVDIVGKPVAECKKILQQNCKKEERKSPCNPVSFLLGVNALGNDDGHMGAYKEYSVSVLVDSEESEFSEFEEDCYDGVDFTALQDFFPHCGGLNPLNFKVSISISPSSPECGPASPRQAGTRGLDAINRSWVNICDTSKSKPKSSKKVQFAPDGTLVTVHPMIAWSYAYQAARKGPWEEYARDRERFNRRLRDAECLLSPVLQHDHRKLVHERILSKQ